MHGAPEGDSQRRSWVKSLIKKYNAKFVFKPDALLTGKCELVTINLCSRKLTPLRCLQGMLKTVERRTFSQSAWQEGHLSVNGLYVGQLAVTTSHPVTAKLYEQTEAAMQRLVDFMDTAPTNLDMHTFQEELLVKVVSQNAVLNVTGLTAGSKQEWIKEVDDGKHKADILDLARSKHAPDIELADLEPLILDKLTSLNAKHSTELMQASCAGAGAMGTELEEHSCDDYIAKLSRDEAVFRTFRVTYEADKAAYDKDKKQFDQKQLKHARTVCDRMLLREDEGILRCKRIAGWGELIREAPGEQQREKARMESSQGWINDAPKIPSRYEESHPFQFRVWPCKSHSLTCPHILFLVTC